jgi:hypothetical protein
MVEKAKDKYISIFECWNSCNMSFDLWMSRVGVDTFIFIVHFLNDKWEPCHVTIDFLETTNHFRIAMALQVKWSDCQHDLNGSAIVYVKD